MKYKIRFQDGPTNTVSYFEAKNNTEALVKVIWFFDSEDTEMLEEVKDKLSDIKENFSSLKDEINKNIDDPQVIDMLGFGIYRLCTDTGDEIYYIENLDTNQIIYGNKNTEFETEKLLTNEQEEDFQKINI